MPNRLSESKLFTPMPSISTSCCHRLTLRTMRTNTYAFDGKHGQTSYQLRFQGSHHWASGLEWQSMISLSCTFSIPTASATLYIAYRRCISTLHSRPARSRHSAEPDANFYSHFAPASLPSTTILQNHASQHINNSTWPVKTTALIINPKKTDCIPGRAPRQRGISYSQFILKLSWWWSSELQVRALAASSGECFSDVQYRSKPSWQLLISEPGAHNPALLTCSQPCDQESCSKKKTCLINP